MKEFIDYVTYLINIHSISEIVFSVVCFLFVLWFVLICCYGMYVGFISSIKDNKKENYGYPYLGFNNPLMDGFE